MTTQTATGTPQTLQTLSARRRQAAAEIQAVDAQRAAQRAQAAAEHAERQAAQEAGAVRLAEHRARLDAIDAFVAEQQRREHAEIRARLDRTDELRRRVEELGKWKPPHVRRPLEEHRAALADLNRYCDGVGQAEEDRLYRECDAWESQACIDPAYKRRLTITHPGGADNCPCAHHEAWRKHWPR